MGYDGTDCLLRLLEEEVFPGEKFSLDFAKQVQIHFVRSGYVSGFHAPTLADQHELGTNVFLKTSRHRYSQKIVSAEKYYHSSHARYDDVMVEAEDTEKRGKVWFGRSRCLLRVGSPFRNPSPALKCSLHGTESCQLCPNNHLQWKEYRFLQYFDIIPNCDLPVDEVDAALNCIRLKWEREGSTSDMSIPGKSFGLCPTDSLRGKIHTVDMWKTVPSLHSSVQRLKDMKALVGDLRGWTSELYYINRFIVHGNLSFEVPEM